MKPLHWTRIVLALSGILAAGIGAAALFWPVGFHAASGIELGANRSLLSELRAPAASLLLAGVFILASAFVRRWRMAGAIVSLALYGSYGAARILSILLDGMPHSTLIQATGIELLFAVLCAAVLLSVKRHA